MNNVSGINQIDLNGGYCYLRLDDTNPEKENYRIFFTND